MYNQGKKFGYEWIALDQTRFFLFLPPLFFPPRRGEKGKNEIKFKNSKIQKFETKNRDKPRGPKREFFPEKKGRKKERREKKKRTKNLEKTFF